MSRHMLLLRLACRNRHLPRETHTGGRSSMNAALIAIDNRFRRGCRLGLRHPAPSVARGAHGVWGVSARKLGDLLSATGGEVAIKTRSFAQALPPRSRSAPPSSEPTRCYDLDEAPSTAAATSLVPSVTSRRLCGMV